MGESANNWNKYGRQVKMAPGQRAQQFAENVRHCRGDAYIIGEQLEKQVYLAWMDGYYFGNNEVMDKWQQYVAMQPDEDSKLMGSALGMWYEGVYGAILCECPKCVAQRKAKIKNDINLN